MKRQSAPRWLVGLCCVLSAVSIVLALVLGNVILTRRQAASSRLPAAPPAAVGDAAGRKPAARGGTSE